MAEPLKLRRRLPEEVRLQQRNEAAQRVFDLREKAERAIHAWREAQWWFARDYLTQCTPYGVVSRTGRLYVVCGWLLHRHGIGRWDREASLVLGLFLPGRKPGNRLGKTYILVGPQDPINDVNDVRVNRQWERVTARRLLRLLWSGHHLRVHDPRRGWQDVQGRLRLRAPHRRQRADQAGRPNDRAVGVPGHRLVGLTMTVRRMEREQRHARDDAKIATYRALLDRPNVRAALAANPSSVAWRAEQGDTELDQVEWTWKQSGRAGKIRLGRTLSKRFAA